MTNPTPLAVLPKPEFIALVDIANEEVVRLTDRYNALIGPEGRLTKAEADLVAANALLVDAIKPESLQAEKAARAVADAEVVRLTAENASQKVKLDAAGAATLQAAAAAGVETPAKAKGADALSEDARKTNDSGATGLQRAINANTELQKPKA